MRRFAYNSKHQQTRVETKDGQVQENRYDAEGLRFELLENGKRTRFVYHQGELLHEEGGDENQSSYHLGAGIEALRRDGENYYYHQDEQLSTAFITGSNGSIQNSYQYDAFGVELKKTEQLSNRIRYTGQQYDSLMEQYYLRARYYNPVLGRFMQEDVYQGDGLNLYAYCDNNPVTYYDPTGYGKKSQQNPYANANTNGDGNQGKSGSDPNEFFIDDWTGYPDAPKPEGPFRILEGAEYDKARELANKTNANIHRDRSDLKGKQIHEVHPVKFGGSPTDTDNKIALSSKDHAKYTAFWNKILRNKKKGK